MIYERIKLRYNNFPTNLLYLSGYKQAIPFDLVNFLPEGSGVAEALHSVRPESESMSKVYFCRVINILIEDPEISSTKKYLT